MTRKQGQRFAFTLGTAFLFFAGLESWRGRDTLGAALGLVGVTLFIAGAVAPTYLGPLERGWMRLAHAIGRVTNPIILAVIYLLVITPIGVVRRVVGGNPLSHQATANGFWKERPADRRRSASLKRQF